MTVTEEVKTRATRNLQTYIEMGLWNGKAQKVNCPVCGHHTFCLKPDKTLAKCFHPSCGFFATIGHNEREGYYSELYNILDEFREIAHKALLEQEKEDWNHAYRYLTQERKIHPEVIRDSTIGIIPKDTDNINLFLNRFDSLINSMGLNISTLAGEFSLSSEDLNTIYNKEKISKKDEGRIGKAFEAIKPLYKQYLFYIDTKKKFSDVFSLHTGWILFFYTDHKHNIKSIKAREPYSKKITHFKPFNTVN